MIYDLHTLLEYLNVVIFNFIFLLDQQLHRFSVLFNELLFFSYMRNLLQKKYPPLVLAK